MLISSEFYSKTRHIYPFSELMAGDTDARKEIRRMRAKQALYEQRERDGPQEVTLALGTRDEYD